MKNNNYEPVSRTDEISVPYLVERLEERLHLTLKSCVKPDNWEERKVTEAELYRPGLALTGYTELFTHQRIQVLGNTECQYLAHLSKQEQTNAFAHLLSFDIPIIFLTDDNKLPEFLLKIARKKDTPIYRTPLQTVEFLSLVRDFLKDQFAMQMMVHGSMVDVYGIGIMLKGKSGIGKSEIALDLVERGHRLVADDAIMLTKKNNVLMASATEMNEHFMEIRGLGIVDVLSMFGIRAVRYQKRLEVIIDLTLWEESEEVERTGLDHDFSTILNLDIPRIQLPITPGKNITVIAEVIAMNYLLRHYGYDPAKAFRDKLKKNIADKTKRHNIPKRVIEYFEGDLE